AHAECAPRRVGRNHAGNTAAGRGRSRRDQHHRGGRPRHAFSLYSCIRKFQIGHTRDIRLGSAPAMLNREKARLSRYKLAWTIALVAAMTVVTEGRTQDFPTKPIRILTAEP